MYMAYELLSDPMKQFLEGLTAIHDGAGPYREQREVGLGVEDPDGGETQVLGRYMPSLENTIDIDDNKGAVNARIKSSELIGLEDEALRFVKIGWAWKVRKLVRLP